MDIIIITGSNGLIGGDAVEYYSSKFDYVIGIDNNFREYFFGSEGSTEWRKKMLESNFQNYIHYNMDVRDYNDLDKIYQKYNWIFEKNRNGKKYKRMVCSLKMILSLIFDKHFYN